jgi:alkylation response protein AidB-like acyl-CoA dehydrogenase
MMRQELTILSSTAQVIAQRHGGADALRARRRGEDRETALWQACVEQGFCAAGLPESLGGAGLGLAGVTTIAEAFGGALLDLPVITAAQMPAAALQCAATERCDALLRGLAAGRRTGLAWQAPVAFPNPAEPAITALKSGDYWCLDGVADQVLGGDCADQFLVAASSDQGVALLWLSADHPGVTVTPQSLLDQRPCGRLSLHDARLGSSALIAVGAAAEAAIEAALDSGRIGLAAAMLGGARAAFAATLEHLKTRQQFDRPIGSFQALQHRCARVYIAIELAAAALRSALDETDLAPRRGAALAKASCGEAYLLAAREGVQMHGGIGVTDEHEIGFHLKAAQVGNTLLGSPAAMRRRWAELGAY